MRRGQEFDEKLKEFSNKDFSEFIPKEFLGLDENKIDTISFVFWLSYWAEFTLGAILSAVWEKQKESKEFPDLDRYLKEIIDIDTKEFEKIRVDDSVFGKKIEIYKKIVAENNYTEILKTIKGLRNNISHLRLQSLSYKDKPILFKESKKELLTDFVKAMTNQHPVPNFPETTKKSKQAVRNHINKFIKEKGFKVNLKEVPEDGGEAPEKVF